MVRESGNRYVKDAQSAKNKLRPGEVCKNLKRNWQRCESNKD